MTLREVLDDYRRAAGPKFAAIVEGFWRREGRLSDDTLRHYVRRLQADGYKPGTVDLHVRTLRAFARRYHLPVPAAPKLDYRLERDSERVALDREMVVRMVEAARRSLPQEAAAMALASTYGLRSGEIARVRAEDVDREGERVFVRSEKGSVQRWCWLPPEIAAWLPDPWQPISNPSAIFRRLYPEPQRPRGVGWHALRRALVRDLKAAGVGREDRVRFLRWAQAGSGADRMDALYASANMEATARGKERVREEDQGRREHDAAVWAAHPYLPLWL